MRKKNAVSDISRRKFITMAGLATTIGLAPKTLHAAGLEDNSVSSKKKMIAIDYNDPLPANKIAEVLENKVICIEPGRFPGAGTAYGLDTNGHTVAKQSVMEPNRYLGWPTLLKMDSGRLLIVFSGDRDSHVCP